MTSVRTLIVISIISGLSTFGVAAEPPSVKRTNVLFLILDQHRWDAMSCAGNPMVKTPNLDRLANEGVRFTRAYSACPVCSPARTTILTGQSIGTHKVTGNDLINNDDLPKFISFDQILLRDGYKGEYHGKYHSPYFLAVDYTEPVRWLNGKKRPRGSKADLGESDAFHLYLQQHVPQRPLQDGELLANLYQRPYKPDPLDGAYGMTQAQVDKLGKGSKGVNGTLIGQGETYGLLDIPPEHTLTAWTATEGLAALDRLKEVPFTLTVSIGPPHPPMVAVRPFYGMYPADLIPVPSSISDDRANSPYAVNFAGQFDPYRDPKMVRQMISDYYGLVTESDQWIGKVLDRLAELGLAENTLIVFTADHGEMLGDHGMHSKMVFYEGSSHVPMILRLPGKIPAGKVIDAPVGHIDLFATILDYCNEPGHESQGESLRPLIEGTTDGAGRFAVSEWQSTAVPAFMVFDGRYKYLCGQSAAARSLDALYDLRNDPGEVHNLIGHNPRREESRSQAERMKGLLVTWLARVKSQYLEGVKTRALFQGAN